MSDSTAGRHWAVCLTLTDEFLNAVVAAGIGTGRDVGPFEHAIELPMMGEVSVAVGLRVIEARFAFREDDGGRIRLAVIADGTIEFGDQQAADGAVPLAVPMPNVPIRVRGEVLVAPVVEVAADGSARAGLDFTTAELLDFGVVEDAPAPAGMAPAAYTQVLQVAQMMLGMTGPDLFAMLGTDVGTAGVDLGPEEARMLTELGVAPGRGEVYVGGGVLTMGLRAIPELRGRAEPVPVGGRRFGVAVAADRFDRVAARLLELAVGGRNLPFELELDIRDQRVGGMLRNPRLLPDSLPDLRSALRYQLRVRLRGGRLEVMVEAAWVELPLVPSFVNDLNRRVGGLVALAPLRFRLPARISLPSPGGEPVTVRADDLRLTGDGVGLTLAVDG